LSWDDLGIGVAMEEKRLHYWGRVSLSREKGNRQKVRTIKGANRTKNSRRQRIDWGWATRRADRNLLKRIREGKRESHLGGGGTKRAKKWPGGIGYGST